jgi:hypothetical protein
MSREVFANVMTVDSTSRLAISAFRFDKEFQERSMVFATADAVGPDDHYVHPHMCVAGRVCFRSTRVGGA